MDWVVEDTIGNWWRPNFEPPQVVRALFKTLPVGVSPFFNNIGTMGEKTQN